MRGNTIQIELPLKRGKVSKTIPLYQYDYGQNLVITGAELPDAYEVHFANEMHGEAVTAIGGSTGVAIPDSVLTSGDPIYLWLYLHEDSTDGETEFQGVIPVIKRASISDQTPTPAEQSAITEAIAALNTAVTQTTAAKNAAVAAQTHIENLSVSATTATPEAGASVTKTVNAQGEVNLAFVIPRGDKGDKGDQGIQGEPGTNGTNGTNGVSPVVSLTKADGVTTFSVTDAVDTYTVEINDGEPGDPTDLIDDTAGSGDTDVTWSANKLDNLTTTVGGKADLVSSPTEGNFAALTSGGNLTDSGHKHSDYLTSHQDITGKADKVSSPTNGDFAALDSNGNLTDSGHKHSDYLTTGTIDDTAGDGDTGKVWSADKSYDVQQSLLTEIAKGQPTATNADIGKFLKLKTIDQNGKPTAFEYGSGGGGGGDVDIDPTLTIQGDAADAKAVGDIVFGLTEIVKSKNLYNKAACNPQDGKWYGATTSGAVEDATKYAITGKIPVEAEKQYTFSLGDLTNIKRIFFFKGESGETYISNNQYSGITYLTFTTPEQCTFVGFNLFATTHTTEQYNAVINRCQLEAGPLVTDYVPYYETRKVPTNKLVDGDALQGASNTTVFASLINWFDKSKVMDNKYFNNTYHEIYDSTSYAFSGLIPVKPNTQYNISCDKDLAVGEMATLYEEWDESRTFIQRTSQNGAFSYNSQIHTGATTKYISINLSFGAAHTTEQLNALLDTIMLVEGTQRPATYTPYNLEPVANHMKLDNMYQMNVDVFRGKKWLVTGTSVSYADSHVFTGGLHEDEVCRGYIGNVARRKPMIVTNEGISGSTLADTAQDSALINRYQSLNFAGYDFITIEYGINDFGRNVTVGTSSDAAGTNTFAACLKTIIEYAIAQNPKVGLIICTEPDVRGTTQNNNNNTLKDYTDVTLEIAKQYRLPVCDWYYNSGINALSKGSTSVDYLTADGTHPNNDGHMRMGAMLNQVFDSLLC